MKKILVVLITLLVCFMFTGCTKAKDAEAPSDPVVEKPEPKTSVVYLINDTLYLSDDALGENVVYTLEDGTPIEIVIADNKETAKVTYTKDDKTVSNDVSVVIDTKEAIEKVIKETPVKEEPAGEKFNWYVEIDGVVYGPDDLVDIDVDTAIAYIKGVFGPDVKYSLETIGAGWDLWYDLDGVVVDAASFGNDCETIAKLRKIWKSGSRITCRNSPFVNDACGLD